MEEIIYCEKHRDSIITHLCINKVCFAPLCAKCIKPHNEFHKIEKEFPEIETLYDIKEICTHKLITNIAAYKQALQSKQFKFFNGKTNDFSIIKNRIIEIMNSFAIDFERNSDNYAFKLDNSNRKENEIRSVLSDLQHKYSEMNGFFSINLLKEILKNNYDDKLKSIFNRDLDDSLVKFNEKTLETFFFDFKQLVQKLFIYDKCDQNNDHQIFQTINKTNIFRTLPFNHQNSLKISDNSPLHYNNSPLNHTLEITKIKPKILDFQIESANYFEENNKKNYLHFFQPKSKILHLFELNERNPLEIIYFTKEISIDFNLPRWHKSLATPKGEIFLLGGASLDKKASKIPLVYSYSFELNTLLKKNSMKTARSCFGVLYFQEKIYAIGGNIDEFQVTTKCEKYDILDDKWLEISKLNLPANNLCLCNFRNSCIYKFGGKLDDNFLNKTIEKYNPNINKWIIINYSFDDLLIEDSFKLMSSSACCQINENQIYVFGGVEEEFKKKTDQSFIFEIQEKNGKSCNLIKKVNEKNVCFAEGFWEGNALIFGNNMYALQNFSNEIDKSIAFLDRRRLLMFNGSSWKCLN